MRVAVVSPYSWTYPGGVNKHVESLAEELLRRGNELRVLAPWDPPDRLSRVLHRARPELRARPDYLIPLARTRGFGANGSVSNICIFPEGVTKLRRELRSFAPDVVHVHEPLVPLIGADACSYPDAPVVGTFHSYSTKPVPNHVSTLLGARRKFNQLSERIAVSEAAAWTGRRWFGGRYTVIPNGVDLISDPGVSRADSELRILFVGRPEERKGLPVLLSAFSALVEHVSARLVVVGAESSEVLRYLSNPAAAERIEALGRVTDERLVRQLREADLLCAPSLSGESFGMVLTEAFAAGTPVVASNIAGYADVVTDGLDGILVPPADPQRLAEELQALSFEPERLARMGEAASESAERYAWPRVAERIEGVYERVLDLPEPQNVAQRFGRRFGFSPADGSVPLRAERLPSLDPAPASLGRRNQLARRVALGVAGVLGIGLTLIAARRIGVDQVVENVVRSDLTWVLVATALMCASLFLRASSWYAIARSALPDTPLRRRDVTSATMIGVLMSATLPARLGEPARAMVLSRRTGRMGETFPALLGTLVSQTALNIVALVILGAIIVGSTDLFHANTERLFIFSLAPLILLVALVLAPTLVRQNGSGRVARVVRMVREALVKVRRGLVVFRDPRRGPLAAVAQLSAWGLQLLACFALFTALGLDHEPLVGIGTAAETLTAKRTAAAVEIATAVALGLPALMREGVTWSDMRMRALSAAPVQLSPHGHSRRAGANADGPASS